MTTKAESANAIFATGEPFVQGLWHRSRGRKGVAPGAAASATNREVP